MIEMVFMRRAVTIFFIAASLQFVNAQYRIEFQIEPLRNDTLILAHYFNKTFSVQDTGIIDNTGKAVLSGPVSLPQGLYLVYLSPSLRFDIILGEDQSFRIATDTTDFITRTKVSGSDENMVFFEYQRYISRQREKTEVLQEKINNSVSEQDSVNSRRELENINKEVQKYVGSLVEKNQNLFAGKFLLAMKEVTPPTLKPGIDSTDIDPLYQVKYIKDHYWDYFDLSDVRMLRTPFYEDKLKNYLDNWVYPVPDSIFKEVDYLMEQSRADTLLFKYMLITLFNHYARSKYVGMDAVYLYIGERYYIPEAWWADKKFLTELEERIRKQSPLLIGKVAPDLQLVRVDADHFRIAEKDTAIKNDPYVGEFFTLHSIPAKYLVLYFWEPECGHCKTVIPKLYEIYEKHKGNGLQVIAVNILGYPKKSMWVDFVNRHHLYDWINAWNPYNIEPSYREVYKVESSNILYMLDEDKKIIIKHVGPEQVEEIIEKGR